MSPLDSHSFDHAFYAVFCGTVDGPFCTSDVSHLRGDMDDAPFDVVVYHALSGEGGEEVSPFEVGTDDLVEVVFLCEQSGTMSCHACGIDDDIKRREVVECMLCVFDIADIECTCLSLEFFVVQGLNECVEKVFSACSTDDVCSCTGKSGGDSESDPGGSPGDEGSTIVEGEGGRGWECDHDLFLGAGVPYGIFLFPNLLSLMLACSACPTNPSSMERREQYSPTRVEASSEEMYW